MDRLLNLSTRPPLPISVKKLHEYYFGVFHKPGSPTDITICQNNHAHKSHTIDFKDKPPNTCLVDTPSLTPFQTSQHDSDQHCVGATNGIPEYVSYHEVDTLLGRVKCGKACGWDGVPSTLVHHLRRSELFVLYLYFVFNLFIHHSYWPNEWNHLLIAPVPKPGKDPLEPSSYRPIHLTSVIAKLLAQVIEAKLRNAVPRSPEQMGFSPAHGTRDNMFVLAALFDTYK